MFCGSSNLALGGEEENDDNLIAIHDGDVATAFAIEAMTLIDHFGFLDRYRQKARARGEAATPARADRRAAARRVHWYLSTTDGW
ncbi:hypothetical protein [Conexibacter woesei]|uniref:hypothetical protein n=1 Tax=Conexibacter woesei TaxID=191495 RepID=UPI0003FC679A|nr:hypothetical protein [Conexibacter woesei]